MSVRVISKRTTLATALPHQTSNPVIASTIKLIGFCQFMCFILCEKTHSRDMRRKYNDAAANGRVPHVPLVGSGKMLHRNSRAEEGGHADLFVAAHESVLGTKRTYRVRSVMSAFRGK